MKLRQLEFVSYYSLRFLKFKDINNTTSIFLPHLTFQWINRNFVTQRSNHFEKIKNMMLKQLFASYPSVAGDALPNLNRDIAYNSTQEFIILISYWKLSNIVSFKHVRSVSRNTDNNLLLSYPHIWKTCEYLPCKWL